MKDYKLEYEILRKEADTNKSYAFERPILIVTVSLAAINFGTKEYIAYVPAFITIILCFNLLFTVNRLFSAGRIIAYILLVIERNYEPYYGWENVLLYHREFTTKLGKKRINKIIKNELHVDMIPKGYGFYPIIYYFHIFILIVTYASLFIKSDKPSYIALLISLFAIIYFFYLLIKFNNRRLRKNLLNERIIMEKVLMYIKNPQIVEELIKEFPDKKKK